MKRKAQTAREPGPGPMKHKLEGVANARAKGGIEAREVVGEERSSRRRAGLRLLLTGLPAKFLRQEDQGRNPVMPKGRRQPTGVDGQRQQQGRPLDRSRRHRDAFRQFGHSQIRAPAPAWRGHKLREAAFPS